MNISPTLTNLFGTVVFELKRNAPAILTTVGVAGLVTSGVLAAKATLKLEDTVERAQQRLDHARGTDQSKTIAVGRNFLELIKLYGVPLTLAGVSVVCIYTARNMDQKRLAGLAIAYKGLEAATLKFRERVREEVGEERERELWHDIRTEEITDGKGKKIQVKTLADGQAEFGPTTFVFGPNNVNWQGTHEFNEFFLSTVESQMNTLLQYRGNVFLNEVLDKLGMERTQEGSVLGWVQKKGEPTQFIDFRKMILDTPMARDLEYPDRGSWMLDFNVQGYIWDEI